MKNTLYGTSQGFDVGLGYGDGPVNAEKVELAAGRVAVDVSDEAGVDEECAVAVEEEGVSGQGLFHALEGGAYPFLLQLPVLEVPDAQVIGDGFHIEDVCGGDCKRFLVFAADFHNAGRLLTDCSGLVDGVVQGCQLPDLVLLHTAFGHEQPVHGYENGPYQILAETVPIPLERKILVVIYPEIIPLFPSPFYDGEILATKGRYQDCKKYEENDSSPYLIWPILGIVAGQTEDVGHNDFRNQGGDKNQRAASQTLQGPQLVADGIFNPVWPHQGEKQEKAYAEQSIVPDAYFPYPFHHCTKIRKLHISASVRGRLESRRGQLETFLLSPRRIQVSLRIAQRRPAP